MAEDHEAVRPRDEDVPDHGNGDSYESQNDPHSVPARTSNSGYSTPDAEDEEGGPIKSFLEHLEDLRWTILKAGAALMVAMVVCLIGASHIFKVLEWPMTRAKVAIQLQWLSPTGGVMSSLKIAFYAGLVVALPFILYFIGEFVIPALKKKEKKFFFLAFSIGSGFFLLGVVTCYFIILPISLAALVQYNNWLGIESTIWRAEDFFEFSAKFMLGVGLLFEVPVLLLSLIRLEIIPPELLVKGRPYMFVVNFVLCAVLTPADLVTTFIMAMILHAVYEVCIVVAKFWARKKPAQEELPA